MRPLNLQEAAQFLRMSRSSLYQRKDIPRYRRPGSRALLFDQDELEMWLKTGRVEFESVAAPAVSPSQSALHSNTGPISVPNISASDALDIQNAGVYHRNPLYR
ncbi:MAG: helix-turn-helix domain-containing protein [Nitrospira sp.]|nr:helix-turn-helix domain-containing protein [Nitrospira sp.]